MSTKNEEELNKQFIKAVQSDDMARARELLSKSATDLWKKRAEDLEKDLQLVEKR